MFSDYIFSVSVVTDCVTFYWIVITGLALVSSSYPMTDRLVELWCVMRHRITSGGFFLRGHYLVADVFPYGTLCVLFKVAEDVLDDGVDRCVVAIPLPGI